MKFFFDNNISEHLSNGLKAFGEDVIHLKELFPENEKDINWLKHIGENKVFLITRDEHVRFNPTELKTMKQNNVGAFFISGKNLSRCKIIQQVVRNWPRIKKLAAKTKTPFFSKFHPLVQNLLKLKYR